MANGNFARNYSLPEFNVAEMTQVPYTNLGDTALAANMQVTDIASFGVVSHVEHYLVRSLCKPEADGGYALRSIAGQLEEPLGTVLCPEGFTGTITNGSIVVLPYDAEHVATYAHGRKQSLRDRKLISALTICLAGSLETHGETTDPFVQEVTYYHGHRVLRRPIAPQDSLMRAAAELQEIERRLAAKSTTIPARPVRHRPQWRS